MNEISAVKKKIKEFLITAESMKNDSLIKAYQDVDKCIEKIERSMAVRAHNLMITKNITYEAVQKEPDELYDHHLNMFPLLRDSARFLIPFRKLRLLLRKFYMTAAILLWKNNNKNLSGKAQRLLKKYAPAEMNSNEDCVDTSHTVVKGWYERHHSMNRNSFLALDYLNGNPVKIKKDRAEKMESMDALRPVNEIIKASDSWYFFTDHCRKVTQTDHDFRIIKKWDIELKDPIATCNFAKGDNFFFYLQSDDSIIIFDQEFKKIGMRIIPGAEDLRKPSCMGQNLFFLNRPTSSIGCSEVLLLDAQFNIRCIYSGLENPITIQTHEGKVVVDDRIGLHRFDAKQNHVNSSLLLYGDLIEKNVKEPYCNGIKYGDSLIHIFIMDNNDFLTNCEISQHIIRIKLEGPS